MKRILLIITLCISIKGTSQSNTPLVVNFDKLPQENIYTHINNNFLLTGETLFYKIYCFDNNNTFSKYSKIAYVELINSDNTSVLKQKVILKKGNGYGDFFIDTDIKTGTYKLIAYTQWMLNKPTFFEKNIFIVNPFSDKLKSTDITQNPLSTPLVIKKNDTSCSLFDNIQSSYKTRQKVTLNFIKKLKFNGNISISIKQKDSLNLPTKTNNKKVNSNSLFNKTNIYLPELRGALIQGTVYNKSDGMKASNIKLSLSIKSNQDFLPQTASTNKKGEFYFNLPRVNVSKISIQILNKERANYKIELKEKKPIATKFYNFPKIVLNKQIIEVIKKRNVYSQIENAYYKVKKDSILSSHFKDSLFDYNKTTFILDDYTRFKTVKETLVEVVKGAGISKKNGKSKIGLTDYNTTKTLSYLPSLLIVDSNIVHDHDQFIKYNSRKIKAISVVNDKYLFGNDIYQGVIIVETFKKNFLTNTENSREYTILPIQPKKNYFFQEHEKNNQRIPDYRTQLYWSPSLNLTKNQFSFYTSDVTGKFEIDAQGFTKDGEFISVKKIFTVN